MAERTEDAGIEVDSGAMFRSIMDTPKGKSEITPPEPPADRGAQPDGGEPALPGQRQDAREAPERTDAPQLTEHQRGQLLPDARPPVVTGPDGRQRDPSTGRFAPAQPGAAPAAPGSPAPAAGAPGATGADEGPHVPPFRLREEREARVATENMLRQANETNQRLMAALDQFTKAQQPKPAAAPQRQLPDPVIDPQGYHAAVMAEVTQAFQANMLDQDLRYTHMRHGDKFERAYEAFLAVAPQHPDFARSVVNGPTPGERMVEWYDRQTMMAEIGPDPRAWMERQLTAALADPQMLQRAIAASQQPQQRGGAPAPRGGGAPAPAVTYRLPPSLSRLPSGSPDTGADQEAGGGAGASENDSGHMFAFATRAQRK